MSAAYGFQFKEIKDIDIGLKYQALRNGDIDVTNGYTTDAQISQDDVRALKDDKSYQVNYFCSTVVRKDALEKYPKLKETLELMDGILTDQKMAELNYQVEEEGRDEAEVAEEFLKTSVTVKYFPKTVRTEPFEETFEKKQKVQGMNAYGNDTSGTCDEKLWQI